MLATPGAVYFQTEYTQAVNIEGNLVTVILSYDSMSSLSIWSKLQGLNFNPHETTTPPLPIKTLYNVTKEGYNVYHLKLKSSVIDFHNYKVLEEYFDDTYNQYPPQPAPREIKKHF